MNSLASGRDTHNRRAKPHRLRMKLVTESELDGNCRGWDGNTTFNFSNGEVWRQSAFRFRLLHLCSPAVRVWRIGSAFLLEVEGAHEVLPVQRLL
jgi:hypothetical protein